MSWKLRFPARDFFDIVIITATIIIISSSIVIIIVVVIVILSLFICHVQSVNFRMAHLVGASVLAAHSIVLVGFGRMEIEDKHQVPTLAHHHLIILILHRMLYCQACEERKEKKSFSAIITGAS